MNILLNASNLRHGGGRTVALQLINAVAPLRPDDKLYVLAPRDPAYQQLGNHPNITLVAVPDHFHSNWLQKMWHNYRVFPKWCKRLSIDRIVSLGNVAFKSAGKPHLLYIQLPQLVYHESPAWKTMDMPSFLRNSLMDQYVALNMRYATAYAVQTEVMRKRLIDRFKLEEGKVIMLPNAPVEEGPLDAVPTPLPQPVTPLKLLFLSRYYAHKHYECLPQVAKLLRERNIPVEITLTIEANEAKGAAAVLDALKDEPNVRNVGLVQVKNVGRLVAGHHGIFLPSLMESFSGAYAEALLHRRLIFTSHYDFATDLLGDAAFYFDPLKPEHIVSVIEAALSSPELIADKLAAIETRAQQAPRIADVARTFSDAIDTFA